jgi:hypothetical protein
MSKHEISFDRSLSDSIRPQGDFTYNITPTVISITDTGLGQRSVIEDIEAVLRKMEYWHQGSITKFKIMCRDGTGFWHKVHWDGKNASSSPLGETDEQIAKKKLLN